MTPGWKTSIFTTYLRNASPEELRSTLDEVLPVVIDVLPAEERVAFFKFLVEEHLDALLQGVSRQQRATLINELLPHLAREFPLDEIDLLSLYRS
jgi:Mg/Co/Ni transporter MgtE